MGKCESTAHRNEGYSGWARTVTDNSTSGGYHNIGSGATSFFVDAHDKNCLITIWAGEDFTGRGRFMRNADHIGIDQRRRWNEPNWNDDTESIRVERIPSANANELEYDINVLRYTPSSPGDNHCGGCRWWPEVKNTGDPKNADRDDVLLVDIGDHGSWQDNNADDKTGRPCPGGKGYFQSNTGVRCIYQKNIGNSLEVLDRTIKDQGITSDPRQPMYDSLKNDICSKIENLNTVVTKDQKTCKDWDTSKALAKQWCEQDNAATGEGNIVDDTLNLCTPGHLGADMYNTLAEEYCKTHPDAEFCKCYNVVHYKTICANRGTSKGCAEAKTKLDSIEEKLGVENATDALPCGTACAGANVYKPDGFQSGCDITYNACIQKIDVGATESEINAVCNIDSGAEGQLTDGGSGGSGGSDGSDGSGSVSTSAVEELKKTIAEDKKKEEEEAKKTKKKLLIGGGGGGIVSSISCLILIVLIVMVMSKKGGGGRR